MYIIICKTDDQCKLMHEAGHPKLVLWDTQKDRVQRGVGGGFSMGWTHVYLWPIHVDG